MRVGLADTIVSEVHSGSNFPFSCADNYHALGEGYDEVKLRKEKIRSVDRRAGGKKGYDWLGDRDIWEFWTPTSGAWPCQRDGSRPRALRGRGRSR